MGMTSEDRQALFSYRMEKSAAVFVEAEDNAKLGHWTLVANRLYYSVFYCTLALLVDKGFSAHTHAGVIHILGKEFVLAGLLSPDDARLVSRLQNMRQSGDYDDMFDWTEEDVQPLIEPTRALLEKMKGLLNNQ